MYIFNIYNFIKYNSIVDITGFYLINIDCNILKVYLNNLNRYILQINIIIEQLVLYLYLRNNIAILIYLYAVHGMIS